VPLCDNVDKYGGARGATNDFTKRGIRVTCWINKAICTHAHAHTHASRRTHALASEHTHTQLCNTYFFLPQQQRFANAPQCYVTCTLPVLLLLHRRLFLVLPLNVITCRYTWLCCAYLSYVSSSSLLLMTRYLLTILCSNRPSSSF
jgi:hypothetical protein